MQKKSTRKAARIGARGRKRGERRKRHWHFGLKEVYFARPEPCADMYAESIVLRDFADGRIDGTGEGLSGRRRNDVERRAIPSDVELSL